MVRQEESVQSPCAPGVVVFMCTDDPSISSQVGSASQADTNSTYQEYSEDEGSDPDDILYIRGSDGATRV